METQRPSVKHSISVLAMVMEVSPSIPSFVLTGLCLTKVILSATGGSMWTAPRLNLSTLSMTRSLQREKLTLPEEARDSMEEVQEEQEELEEEPEVEEVDRTNTRDQLPL